ncbi:MAG TPA: response regulator [Gammaproteobacteria bacterium]|nr:response regulator [Gammaproteobacteria bacterium]
MGSSAKLNNQPANTSLSVLVADDDIPNRLVLQALLERQGYHVIQADDGIQAVEMFKRERPDLVLMDITMPHMDGYEATRRIKAMSEDTFVPVIFLTATSDREGLAKCVESGGDDFLTKPYNRVLLQARIDALMRIRDLYSTVQDQRNELANHQKRLDRERQLAKRLFSNIIETSSLDLPYVQSMLSPMSLFSGDILLAAPKPSGGLHVLLGDFTGHGLAAAIGALPVSSVFYGMTTKGYSIAEIVTEINRKLKKILPTDMFLAACIIDINPGSHTLSVWNGGIPSVIIYGEAEQEIIRVLPSRHLPLGIANEESFNRRVEILEMRQNDRIYMYSDGLTEATNPDGVMFGNQRLEGLFIRNRDSSELFNEIRREIIRYQAGGAQQDDMTMIELRYDQQQLEDTVFHDKTQAKLLESQASAWSFSMELSADLLTYFDPLPLLIQAVCDMQSFRGQRQQLYTVFSELFSNALDHGILNLDSTMKRNADGFAKYYMEREARLSNLREGSIKIFVAHEPNEEGGLLTIRVEDSGEGFDFRKKQLALENNVGHSGRGIQLLDTICEKVEFKGNGNIVEATYRWH